MTTQPDSNASEITSEDVEEAVGIILAWIELDRHGAEARMTISCPQAKHAYHIIIRRDDSVVPAEPVFIPPPQSTPPKPRTN